MQGLGAATCTFSVPSLPRTLRKVAPIPCAPGRPTEAVLLVPGGDSGSFYCQVYPSGPSQRGEAPQQGKGAAPGPESGQVHI